MSVQVCCSAKNWSDMTARTITLDKMKREHEDDVGRVLESTILVASAAKQGKRCQIEMQCRKLAWRHG